MLDKNIINAVSQAKSTVVQIIEHVIANIKKEEKKKRNILQNIRWILFEKDKMGIFKDNLDDLISLYIDKLFITSRDITYLGGEKVSNKQDWEHILKEYKEDLDNAVAQIKYYKKEDLQIVKDALDEYFETLYELSEEF